MATALVNMEISKSSSKLDFYFYFYFLFLFFCVWFLFGVFHGHPVTNNPVDTKATWPYQADLKCVEIFLFLVVSFQV
jgi:hypothetical protein